MVEFNSNITDFITILLSIVALLLTVNNNLKKRIFNISYNYSLNLRIVIVLISIVVQFSVCYGQANRFAGFGYINTTPAGCSSADYLTKAQLYIDSSGITDTIEIRAAKEFTKSLLDSCLWTKMASVYLFLGSSANSTKFNLVSPFTQDTSYRILWYGGMSYGSYGVKGNAVNGYGDTRFKPNMFLTDSGAIGVSVGGANLDQTSSVIGCIDGSFKGWGVYPRISNVFYSNAGQAFISTANTDSRGVYIVTGTSTLTSKTFRNNVLFIASNGGTVTTNTNNLYITGRNNNGSIDVYGSHEIGLIFISKGGLNDRESKAMYDIISTFKTTLGR